MRYLFIHPVFPGQFHRLMASLAADPTNEVCHLSQQRAVASVPGVHRFRYALPPQTPAQPLPHPFLAKLHDALRQGDAVTRALLALKAKGYRPDIIYGYTGWGHTFYVKDVFPEVPLIGYFEWYLNPFGSEYNFDPDFPLGFDHQRYLRINNANMLIDLAHCDAGITPTRWQRQQFPQEFRAKLHCLHDGVDTGRYCPGLLETLTIGEMTLRLEDVELVTYATRGMEPFRGFPQFMRALVDVQAQRPRCHAVIAGTEEVFYSRKPTAHTSYKEALLKELSTSIDPSRIHFAGWLGDEDYLRLLQASALHVYLTYPYVLSWSLLEAMASGCLVVASNTPPVAEVIRHGENGLLVDFFNHHQLARTMEEALAAPASFRTLRHRARATVERDYATDRLLPAHIAMLNDVVRDFHHGRRTRT